MGVRRVQRVSNLHRDVDHRAERQRFAVDLLLEGLSFEQFHRDELRPLELVDLVDGADVRVIQRRSGARLAQKAIDGLLIAGAMVRQKLERHRTGKLDVLGLVDDAHPPGADGLEHTVVRDDLAKHVNEGTAGV